MDKFSIVIVTYGRSIELQQLLDSIARQCTMYALEKVVVVDNHSLRVGREVVKSFETEFCLDYIENDLNSLTKGRSIGVEATDTDVVLFLDDDVVLDDDYFRNMMKFYVEHPNANGMQGMFFVDGYSKLKNMFNRIFFLFNYSSSEFKAYPSIQASYGCEIAGITSCEWFSGTNFSYKRHVLDSIPFDFNLVKYSEGEDIDFSFRAYKSFGGLFANPACRVQHQAAITSRELGEEFALMQEVYGLYLLEKLFPESKLARLKYTVSRIGKLIIYGMEIVRLRPHAVSNLLIYVKAVCRSHYDPDISKFNSEIL